MADSMENADSTRQSRIVTRGFLEEFGTIHVLQALSLSRQYTAVELFTEDGKAAGRVTLKSGMVLEASLAGSSLSGAAAFRELVGRNLHAFQVERLPKPERYPEPIGRLAAQLLSTQKGHLAIAATDTSERSGESIADVAIRESQRPADPASESRVDAGARVRPVHLSPAPDPGPPTRYSGRSAAPDGTSSTPHVHGDPAFAPSRRVRRTTPPANSAPVVAIASPKGGCGKTTLALNLAVSLARGGLRVVLVDADPNGDILSAIACRSRATSGVFDALSDDAEVSSLAMETAIPGLSVIPAMGDEIPASLRGVVPDGGLWRRMLEGPRQDADIVLIDAPAGMFGVAGEILDACTHVLGVLQAESIPKRSFDMFQRGLLARKHAPEVVGVVLNMFRRSHSASVSVLVEAGQELPPKWLFETTIPRNDVFMDATERGMPVILSGSSAATFVGGLFDALASEIRDRLDLAECARPAQPGAFLL